MNYAQLRKYDVANGEGIRTTLFVSGCSFNCKNCFNKDYQDFNYGKSFTFETIEEILENISDDNIRGLSVLGGEVFMQNPLMLLHLLSQAKINFPQKDIWVWTGYKLENIPKEYHMLFPYIDVLIDGQFEEDKKDLRLSYRGSSNQKIWRKSESGGWYDSTNLQAD